MGFGYYNKDLIIHRAVQIPYEKVAFETEKALAVIFKDVNGLVWLPKSKILIDFKRKLIEVDMFFVRDRKLEHLISGNYIKHKSIKRKSTIEA